MAVEDGPQFEERKQHVFDALEAARFDWMTATDPLEAEIHMTAIDHLLDLAQQYGYIALQGIDNYPAV
jgi:hypothetical protein